MVPGYLKYPSVQVSYYHIIILFFLLRIHSIDIGEEKVNRKLNPRQNSWEFYLCIFLTPQSCLINGSKWLTGEVGRRDGCHHLHNVKSWLTIIVTDILSKTLKRHCHSNSAVISLFINKFVRLPVHLFQMLTDITCPSIPVWEGIELNETIDDIYHTGTIINYTCTALPAGHMNNGDYLISTCSDTGQWTPSIICYGMLLQYIRVTFDSDTYVKSF